MKFFLLILTSVLIHVNSFSQNKVSTNGVKHVLLEHTAGAWNALSPDAISISDKTKVLYPVTIIARHHSNDAMQQPSTQQYHNAFNGQGYPKGSVDRNLFAGENNVITSRSVWPDYTLIQSQLSPTFDIDIIYSYDTLTRGVDVTIEATTLTALQGKYAVNLFVVEDSVTGTGSGYDQKNDYDNTTGHAYYGAGDPIKGFIHMNVVRMVLGGVYGDEILTNPAASAKGAQTYSFVLPQAYNARQIRLIAFVAKYTPSNPQDCEVQNSIETDNDLYCAYLTPKEKLCIVSVDTTSNKIVLGWEPALLPIKQYRVYKESSGGYQLIGAVPWNTNTYTDNNANPKSQSYKYKITTVDSCDKELFLDSATTHNTIHLSYAVIYGNKRFVTWTPYTGSEILSYVVKRSNIGNGYNTIAQLPPGTTGYVDTNAPAGVNEYRVEAELKNVCNFGSPQNKYVYSNTATAWPTGISKMSTEAIAVIPNPAKNTITISGLEDNVCAVQVYNTVGQQVIYSTLNTRKLLDVSTIPSGLYILKISSKEKNYIIQFRKL